MRRGKTGGEPSTAQRMCSCCVRLLHSTLPFKLSITRNVLFELTKSWKRTRRSKMGKRYSYPLYDKILREKDEISSQYVANRDNIPYIVARSNRRKRRGGISRIESSSPSSSKPSFAARQPYPTSSIFRLREKKRQKGEKKKKTTLRAWNKRILPELVPAFFSSDRTN